MREAWGGGRRKEGRMITILNNASLKTLNIVNNSLNSHFRDFGTGPGCIHLLGSHGGFSEGGL